MIGHDEVYNYDRYEDEHNEESGKDEERKKGITVENYTLYHLLKVL